MTGRWLLEVCVGDPEGLDAAVAGGADRIELCSALELGGLTPSPGLLRRARGCPVPVHVLLRPRPGDFCYSPAELAALADDLEAVVDAGLDGVVLGVSRPDLTLDEAALAALVARAGELQKTLHRVFDLVPDRAAALETAVRLGFGRILTSGGASTAPEGAAELARLVRSARGRIILLAGGGVRAETVPLLADAGITEFHASCSVPGAAEVPGVVRLGFGPERRRRTDARMVAALRRELDTSAVRERGSTFA